MLLASYLDAARAARIETQGREAAKVEERAEGPRIETGAPKATPCEHPRLVAIMFS
jgi:hypothetical protein